MCDLQKPITGKLLAAFILVIVCCQANRPQKSPQPAPPVTLTKCWIYPTDKLTDFDFASDNKDFSYVVLADSELISISLSNGKKYWETELGGAVMSAPLVEAESVYVVVKYANQTGDVTRTSNNRSFTLRSLNKATGVMQWRAEFTNKFSSSETVHLFSFEDYLVLVSNSGDVYSVNKPDGKIIWKKNFGVEFSSQPFLTKDAIVLGTSGNTVIYLSIRNGQLLESFKIPLSLKTVVESKNGGLIVGDGKGALTFFNKKQRTQNWKYRNGAEVSNVLSVRQGLLVTSFDNYVYLISETDGKLLWKRRLSGRIRKKPQVFEDYLIVTATDDTFASIIDLYDGKLLNRIALESDNFFTGGSIRAGNYFVYATRKGVFGFANSSGDCVIK